MIEKLIAGLAVGALAVAVLAALSAVFALPVMWLWNGVGPNLFAPGVIKPIDFWNAWGLSVLCGLLFKNMSASSSRD